MTTDVATSDPKEGDLLDGRYRLLEQIGAGGMGVVHRGERVGIGKVVAIKLLHPSMAATTDVVKRFKREVAAMGRLAHPHLTAIIDSGVAGGLPFLVLEFLAGRPLGAVIADGPLPLRRAVGITRQILAGMRHAHAGGIIHRDLKPGNIFLLDGMSGDFVKILDFGLARIARGDGEDASMLTAAGTALGTPSYMSPEQAKGGKADRRSDLYAVGAILYQMVSGKKPFSARSPVEVLRMQIHDPPPPLLGEAGTRPCSVELERVILRALQKQPARRWQTAADFAAALEATPEGRGSALPAADTAHASDPALDATLPQMPAVGASPPSRSTGADRRRFARRALPLVALVVALLVGGAWLFPDFARRALRDLGDGIHHLLGGPKLKSPSQPRRGV